MLCETTRSGHHDQVTWRLEAPWIRSGPGHLQYQPSVLYGISLVVCPRPTTVLLQTLYGLAASERPGTSGDLVVGG